MRQRDELELLRWRISFVGYVIAAMVLVLGRPLLAALDRAARRMRLDVGPPPAASPVGTVDPASHRVPV